MKNTKMRIFALILVLVLSLTALSSCIYPGYMGEYPELCSVAWANLVDIIGYWSDGEMQGGPYVDVLETDSYGRVLFSYSEHRYIGDAKSGYLECVYLMVMQKKDDLNAYYYPEDCYYCVKVGVDEIEHSYESDVVEQLKLLNDWDKPIDTAKCDTTVIVNKRPKGRVQNANDDQFLEGVIRRYHERSGRYISPKNISFVNYDRFVTADRYGRELWTVYTSFEDHTEKMMFDYSYKFLIVFMPDGSCDESTVIMLDDSLNAQDAVKNIKASNNWNKPIE